MSLYSMSETYPCEVCCETFSKVCRFKNQQNTHSGEKPYPCTLCHRRLYKPVPEIPSPGEKWPRGFQIPAIFRRDSEMKQEEDHSD